MKIFHNDESQILIAEFEGETYTFIIADKLYIVVSEINEGGFGNCVECFSNKTKTMMIGRCGNTYKLRWCSECNLTSIEKFEYDRDLIPVKALKLIDLGWQKFKEA